MNPNKLTQHIAATYQATRIGLAIIALCFPPWLVFGAMIFGPVKWQDSMSAYYHASVASDTELAKFGQLIDPGEGVMRNWFVGLLFALGIILYLYRGFTNLENWALNIGGLMALGVALFPMEWGKDFPGLPLFSPKSSVHGACAVSLFICIAYVCIYRAPDTLPLLKNPKLEERYRKIYRVLGHLMWVSPIIAWVLSFTVGGHKVFLMEIFGVWIFAIYWGVKSWEIHQSSADLKAMTGAIQVEDHGISHMLKPIKIQ